MLTVYLCEDHPEELDFFKETILKILDGRQERRQGMRDLFSRY